MDDNENSYIDFINIDDDDLDCKISEQEVRRAVFKQKKMEQQRGQMKFPQK